VLSLLISRATIQDIQKRQEHESVAATETCADQLQEAENSYAGQIVALFGLLPWGMYMFSCPVKEGLVSSYKRILVPSSGSKGKPFLI
jgi:hypothetical protein